MNKKLIHGESFKQFMSECALKMFPNYLHTYPEESQTLTLQRWQYDIHDSPAFLFYGTTLLCYCS